MSEPPQRQRTVARGNSSSLPRSVVRGCLLCLLHVVYGWLFLLEHLVRRPWRSSSSPLRATSADLQGDARGWKRVPRHVAIAFSPVQFEPGSRNASAKPLRRLRNISEDVSKLAEWCLALGIERLSAYDAPGLARSNPDVLCKHLPPSLEVLVPPSASNQPNTPVPVFVVNSLDVARKGPSLRISLLSEQDGKQHVSMVAQRLTEAARAGYVAPADITVDFMQEKMQSSLMSEPDLLIVLGEPSLRLHGFPPWHIRLTEIYHEPSLSLLGPARLSYRTFRRALEAYAASEQRRGK